eukprot:g3303.t1
MLTRVSKQSATRISRCIRKRSITFVARRPQRTVTRSPTTAHHQKRNFGAGNFRDPGTVGGGEPGGNFLGQKTAYKEQGWEWITFLGLFGGTAFCVLGFSMNPRKRLQDWARQEAEAREDKYMEGEHVELGTQMYEQSQKALWQHEGLIGTTPSQRGDE